MSRKVGKREIIIGELTPTNVAVQQGSVGDFHLLDCGRLCLSLGRMGVRWFSTPSPTAPVVAVIPLPRVSVFC